MSYEVSFTSLARRDYDENIGYIVGILKNVTAARNLRRRFKEASGQLSVNPESSRLSDIGCLAELGVRVRYIGGYDIFYIFTGDRVVILRFVSALMDTYSDDFIESVIEGTFEDI